MNHNHSRRLSLFVLACLAHQFCHDLRPIALSLRARKWHRLLTGRVSAIRAGIAACVEWTGFALVACFALMVFAFVELAKMVVVERPRRKPRHVPVMASRPPVPTTVKSQQERFPLPVLPPRKVSLPLLPIVLVPQVEEEVVVCKPVAATPRDGLFVASPRKDARRAKASVSYTPWKGKALRPGQYLVVKEGRSYRRVTDDDVVSGQHAVGAGGRRRRTG